MAPPKMIKVSHKMASYRESHVGKSEQYDRDLSEDAFDAYMARLEANFLHQFVPALFPVNVPQYLDFACGTGRITSLIETYAHSSYGVDVSESMQTIAKKKCSKTTFFLQDICDDPLPIAPADLVTAFRFFGNAEDELRFAALKAINRHLSKGGYLIINNHRNPSSTYIRLEKLRGGKDPANLSPQKLQEMLRKCGFSIVKTLGIGWWFVHRRLNSKVVCESGFVSAIESISRAPLVYNYCPDYVLVARKES